MTDERVLEQVRLWRDDLLSLTRRSNLLYFSHPKVGSLEITSPDPATIVRGLHEPRAAGWYFTSPVSPETSSDTPEPTEVLPAAASETPTGRIRPTLTSSKPTASDLAASLRTLHRTSTQDFLDKGIWILYLGIGILEWIDPQEQTPATSPILLVPVRLERASPREPFRLVVTEGESVLNPALAIKLESEFDIVLPASDPESGPEERLDAVRSAVAAHRNWSVSERVVLARFSFQKEVMYQDLRANEAVIADHPLIAALTGTGYDAGPRALSFDPVPEEELDERVPPEERPTVLDADSSQRRCIEAAARGASFVMDGPPGTGKSQTIANIIAELLRLGRRVLFVSEKAAALDVVATRLSEAGLEDFLLPLHEPKMTRKEVATSLATSLHQRPSVRSSIGAAEIEALRSRRRNLSAYAAALNEVRQPLGRSLHDVIGRVSCLHHLPQAPVASKPGTALSAEELVEITEAARALARAWGPVERADAFVWRNLTAVDLDAGMRHRLESELNRARTSLASLQDATRAMSTPACLDTPASTVEARRLLEILALLDRRPPVPAVWLTTKNLAVTTDRLAELGAIAAKHSEHIVELTTLVGTRWSELDDAQLTGACVAAARLARSVPDSQALGQARLGDVELLEQLCAIAIAIAPDLLAAATRIADHFGLDPGTLTVERCSTLARLARLAISTHQPAVSWLNPAIAAQLIEARDVLGRCAQAVLMARERCTAIYADSIVTIDLDGLVTRFATVHKGFGKFRAAYREDKATLIPHLHARRITPEALAHLESARLWQATCRELERGERKHAAILRDYYDGTDTDFGAIDDAIATARTAVELAGRELDAERFASALATATGELLVDADALCSLLGRLAEVMDRLPSGLVPSFIAEPLAGIDRSASELAPEIAATRLGLAHLAAVVSDANLTRLRGATSHVTAIRELDRVVNTTRDADVLLLGPGFVGTGSDFATLASSLGWAADLRCLVARPISESEADHLLACKPSSAELTAVLDEWERCRDAVLANFEEPQRGHLAARFDESFLAAETILEQLAATTEDVSEWIAFSSSVMVLLRLGFGEQVELCTTRRVDAATVPDIVERSILEGFVDETIRSDDRLRSLRSVDRDALVAEFKELDHRLFALASAQTIAACVSRRPTSIVGQAAVIVREAEKMRRHMPIRDLLAQTAAVAQVLKPCFMMSPLTVSQFLSPAMGFDTVIFDEASQVRPPDAVNAVYRASQLIVAGDQRQLPPTSFFDPTSHDETDEYEEGQFEEYTSLLDLLKGQGGFEPLPLRWHYRSQHEALITYSNYSFYDGRLVTFPSANQDGPDVGIELYKVDGVYRRGGARDNPVEAEAVVDRICEHARRRPKLSLGVVAFSEAQASAIEVALDRRRRNLPELDSFFGEDRLHGFFVKNLESVQGDERDVIIFSIGYGPDEVGKFTMNFGPLNRQGGERRLNVAITRARRRVEIITSVTAGQFSGQTTSDGVRHLHRYLDFAERGIAALGLDLDEGAGDAESPFEEEVLRVLRSWGYEVVPQVGQSGYRIDLGVRDPRAPGRYLLGVECDGAAYHSSKVARDRDRLRHEVLAGLGWNLHHIWGTAWYRERERAEEQLRQAIDAALEGPQTTMSPGGTSPLAVELAPVKLAAANLADSPHWATPYKAARLELATRGLEMHADQARPLLVKALSEVIVIESPVHVEVALRRIREAWGVGRAGNRIRETFDEVIALFVRSGRVQRDRAGFLRLTDRPVDFARIPVDGDPSTQRSIEHVPLGELAYAVLHVVHEAYAVETDELCRYVARIFGWKRAGDGIVARLDEAIDRLAATEKVMRDGSTVTFVRATPT